MPPEIHINLHPVNFIIISGILQCMVVALVLLFSKTGNRSANRYVAFFIFICALHFAWSMVMDLNLADLVKQVFWIPYSFLLAIGPLLFFYTKSLSESDFRFGGKYVIHFVPVILEAVLQMIFIGKGIRDNVVHYAVPGFLLFRIFEYTVTVISIVVYGKKSLVIIRRHEADMVQNFSNQKDVTLSWLYSLIRYLRVLWIFWLVFELSFLIFLRFQMHFIPVYLLLYILLGIITYSNYWIGMRAFQKSEALVEKPVVRVPVEYQSVYARLRETDIKHCVERLNQLMQKEKLYLHETLTLRTLASRLEMDPNLVSYVLNNILHKSFYDYVNEFRIEAVKQKIADPAYNHLKIVEVAYDSGFNSKATFNRTFKKLTGQSPSDYRQSVSGGNDFQN